MAFTRAACAKIHYNTALYTIDKTLCFAAVWVTAKKDGDARSQSQDQDTEKTVLRLS